MDTQAETTETEEEDKGWLMQTHRPLADEPSKHACIHVCTEILIRIFC